MDKGWGNRGMTVFGWELSNGWNGDRGKWITVGLGWDRGNKERDGEIYICFGRGRG